MLRWLAMLWALLSLALMGCSSVFAVKGALIAGPGDSYGEAAGTAFGMAAVAFIVSAILGWLNNEL